MKKTSVFIDGYNLYHAIKNLRKSHLKWVNLFNLSQEFAKPNNGFQINRVQFFTAPPIHKSIKTQQKYNAYIQALKHYDVEIIEGKFKKKLISYKDSKGKIFTRTTHEEKESDVNLALAILEDAIEKISDQLLVITNDSDISPAIKLALTKNPNLRINVITPPLTKTKKANYDLLNACKDIKKDKKGQVFFKPRMIIEQHLEDNLLPEKIIINGTSDILMPKEYKKH